MSTGEALYLDHETRSTVDLRRTGVDIYRRDPTTDVIITCGAIGKGDVLAWRPGDPVPLAWDQHIRQGGRIVAHNAPFEIAIHNILVERYGWPEARLEQFDCTMARARAAGLPGSLEGSLVAMGARIAKDKAGHALMMRMCKPRRIEPDGRIVWWDDEERVQRLIAYCVDDVRGERWLDFKLPPLTAQEHATWLADRRLNARGVPLDIEFLHDAQAAAAEARVLLDGQMKRVTKGFVPKASNVGKLREWLLPRISNIDPLEDPPEDDEDDEEDALPELRRRDVQRLLLEVQPGTPEHEALTIRLEAGKSSVKKVDAMLRRLGPGQRVRDMLMYYGAQTGRWSAAGSGIQLQNLPRDGVKDWARARRLLAEGADAVELVEGSTLDVISRMLRGAIALPPREPGTLVWADYSSVEARGVAWLAGQDDLVEAFRSGAKIYERMAGRIFDMPEASIGKESFERWVGKGVVLGSGYQMGADKFQGTCAAQGRAVPLSLAIDAITAYREAFPKIPQLWYGMEECAMTAIRRPGETFETAEGRVRMSVRNGWLIMRLPTGSFIRYRNPRLERDERFDKLGVVYDGVDSKTKKWGKQRTYGGRLTENAVQRICRDIVAHALPALEAAGYEPILLVHDEIINYTRRPDASYKEVEEIICRVPAGLEGFPIAAEGKMGRRYAK